VVLPRCDSVDQEGAGEVRLVEKLNTLHLLVLRHLVILLKSFSPLCHIEVLTGESEGKVLWQRRHQ
jgi:hypothetical protein